MKNSFFLLFLVLNFSVQAQKISDSTRYFRNDYDEVDCNIVWKNNQKLFKLFKKEAKKIDYKSLSKVIIKDFDIKNIPDKNIIFKLYTTETVYATFTICGSNLNIKNPNYNYLDFYTPENIKLLQKKLKKNLYFDFSDSKFENNEYRPIKKETINHPFYQYLKNMRSADKTVCYDPDTVVSKPITLNEAGWIQLNFRNHLGGIVIVKYDYFIYNKFSPVVFKTYKYQDRKWVEIPTKDEHLF
ncbi:hypothetical protein [Chryseobacterium limigenitum]|uniref:Uncharacterized protein n=1 Tax=Chryseobacterium limigenitum TaxID=1612149 RepID=A0A1K2IXT2_9FLAO|nr:hypothetical protein [Chryseobacterium limigenitum]SFZ97074.1 hypothetical protein SAMN05216324_1385 [Chryseobacterium limigenitum]